MQDGCHLQVNQIELVWVRVRVEWECFWVNLREDNQGVWIQDGSVWIQHNRIRDGCHYQVESEWMSDFFFVQMVGTNIGKCEWVWEEVLRWLNPRWLNSTWQWEWMSQVFFVQNGWIQGQKIQDDRIQDGCHHQVESDWMSKVFFMQMAGTNLAKCEWVWEKKLRWPNPRYGCNLQVNHIELVWVRFRVNWECFWMNLRDDNKGSESKIAVSESIINMAEFKMAAIINMSLNEWVKFFLQMVGTNLGKCEWF